MKRKAIPVLVVALSTATAACGGGVADPDPTQTSQQQSELNVLNDELSNTPLSDAIERRDHFRPLCDAKGYPLVGNINAKGATASQFCEAVRAIETRPTKPPAPTCDTKALHEELSCCTELDGAVADRARFRCLCDEQGYPLVGNINSKGTPVSAFCKALRDKNLL